MDTKINSLPYVGTTPVLFSSPVSVIARIRDTLDHLVYKTVNSSVSMIRKEKIRSSQTASTLFYTKRSRVSRTWAIMDTDTGEEKRTGV